MCVCVCVCVCIDVCVKDISIIVAHSFSTTALATAGQDCVLEPKRKGKAFDKAMRTFNKGVAAWTRAHAIGVVPNSGKTGSFLMAVCRGKVCMSVV